MANLWARKSITTLEEEAAERDVQLLTTHDGIPPAVAALAGNIVILDNLASHKVAGVREANRARGASLVHLPPYSPDLNPIEQAFAKIKALLRKLAARTVNALWDAVGDILARFTPQECVNY